MTVDVPVTATTHSASTRDTAKRVMVVKEIWTRKANTQTPRSPQLHVDLAHRARPWLTFLTALWHRRHLVRLGEPHERDAAALRRLSRALRDVWKGHGWEGDGLAEWLARIAEHAGLAGAR